MKEFFKLAFFRKSLYFSLFFNIFAFLALTIFNNLEMVSLGMLAQDDIGFFSLFNKNKNQIISVEEIDTTLKEIDFDKKGQLTQEKISKYRIKHGQQSLLERVYCVVKNWFSITTNLRLAVFILSIVILKSLALFLSRFSTRILSINIAASLKERYFSHLQRLKYETFMHYDLGQLASRVVSDASQISQSINSLVLNTIYYPICMMVSFIACICLSYKLTFIVLVAVPSIFIPILWITRRVKKYTHSLQLSQDSFLSIIVDFLSGINIMKIFSMENYIFKKFCFQNNRIQRLEKKINFYDLLTRPILHIITIACLGVILFIGLNVLRLSLSEILVFCALLHQFYEPIRKFADENANVQKGVVATTRLLEILELEVEDVNQGKKTCFNHGIHLENLSFSYGSKWVLRDINLKIKKGEIVAIVGSTGSGKSTLLQIISSLLEPSEGSIYFDGVSFSEIQKSSLRDLIAYVNQQTFVYYDTVYSNIAFGRDILVKDVRQAAEMAEIDKFIDSLENGYDSLLLEGGKTLSGGQKQRICLARAFAKNAKILLLDEATSSLDNFCEMQIKERLKGLVGDITQIIVSHKISFIEHADKIVFLQDGHIYDQGSYSHLIKNCEPFKRLVLSSKSDKKELLEL